MYFCAMKFVYPEFLWALSLLLAPIAIHLFSFRKHRTLYFSSLKFVQQIEQQNKSVQKIKHFLLLLCRLLAITALIIAFAQPYIPEKNRGGASTFPLLAIHIDNSFSMTMKGVEGELLSEAIETARKLIEKTPINGKILLSTNVMDGVEARLCTKMEAIERLDLIKASPMQRSYQEVIKWQKNNLKNNIKQSNLHDPQLVYLSDFQKSTHLFENIEPDSTYSYFPIRFKIQDPSNLSIDSVWFASPLHKIGVNNELFIKVSNHGQVGLQNVSMNLETDMIKRDLFIDLDPQSSTITSLTFAPKTKGIQKGKLSITDKQFFADDDYFFTYNVNEQSDILIVNGADAHPSVGQIYQLDQFYNVNQVAQTSFTMNMLQRINLVVLNGINDISSGFRENLIEYSKNGGTIAFFPGENINYRNVNSFLNELNLPKLSDKISQNYKIQKINYKDPFFRGVFDEEKEKLSLPGVTKFYLTTNNKNSTAMKIIELQNGRTLLYRNQQPNQSFLFTSVLSPEYGSFLTDILYTTMLLRIGELSLMNPPLFVTIGKTNNYPIYQPISNDLPVIIRGEKNEFIPETRTLGHITSIDLSGASAMLNLQAGIFDLINNQNVISKIAVNYDRVESKIETWTENEIKTKLKEAGIKNINVINIEQGFSKSPLRLEHKYPYWKILIIATLFFVLAELFIHIFYSEKKGT